MLTQQLLEDKQATSLKEVGRTTAGVTLGTGEGGNAFGDRFFIRGFDARNDVFVDGIRDPAVNIRENFFTEQVEILKGPSATIDGRGTSGGAINIVTKQAGDNNFYDSEATLASDNTKRVTFDVNQVINPTLSVRIDGMAHDADVSERNYTTDKRDGLGAAVKWAPTNDLKVTANFLHTYLWGLPDFGVPYNNLLGAPVTSLGVPRDTYYGFVNRDFTVAQQDLATQNIEYHLGDAVTLNNKVREERSVLNYIGTIPEQAVAPKGCGGVPGAYSNLSGPISTWTTCLNPQSRNQVTDVLADEFTATTKFFSGPVEHTVVTGALISREEVNLNSLYRPDVGGYWWWVAQWLSACTYPYAAKFGCFHQHPDTGQHADGHSRRHPKSLCARNGKLSKLPDFHCRPSFRPDRRQCHQRRGARTQYGFGIIGHMELQSRSRLQADPDHQPVRRLWHRFRACRV